MQAPQIEPMMSSLNRLNALRVVRASVAGTSAWRLWLIIETRSVETFTESTRGNVD